MRWHFRCHLNFSPFGADLSQAKLVLSKFTCSYFSIGTACTGGVYGKNIFYYDKITLSIWSWSCRRFSSFTNICPWWVPEQSQVEYEQDSEDHWLWFYLDRATSKLLVHLIHDRIKVNGEDTANFICKSYYAGNWYKRTPRNLQTWAKAQPSQSKP